MWIVGGMLMISSNDAIMKLSSEQLGVGQLLFVRGSFALILFSAIIKLSGRTLLPRGLFMPLNGMRALCECVATMCFITALSLLPIATASTLVWTTPLLLTLSAAFILKERVTVTRWLAVATGFLGVLLVTNPFGVSFSAAMGLPILAAVFVCIRDLLTRRIDQQLDSLHVVLASLFFVTIAGLLMSLGNWQPVTASRAMWLCLSALLLGGGFLFQVKGMRLGELSYIAPFSYVGILAAVFYGYVIWQQFPGALSLVGILLIVGSGIYILSSTPQAQPRQAQSR